MRPYRVLLFIASVMACLAALCVVLPGRISFGSHDLRWPTLAEVFDTEKEAYPHPDTIPSPDIISPSLAGEGRGEATEDRPPIPKVPVDSVTDSRMFLAPVPVQSGLAYIGTSGFRRPTLGVYVEWWMTCIPAIISRLHNDTWLVYYIAGSPLSGMNCCDIVNANGECRSENLPNPFRAIWGPFTNINTRYDEAKVRYEAYSLEEVVKLLEANDKGDSLTERKLYLLQRENQVLRQEILDTREVDAKAMEKMRVTLLNAHLECKREALTNWYADYCRRQEEGKEVLESLNLQKQQLKQQFRHGEITRMFYQHKLTPLKKRIFNLQQELECMAKKELSELLPELFNRPGDTELITFDEVEEFVKSKNPNQK